ncbi:uncharacterized protein LOC110033148 [Phalaenopsis equestris]|uniref:uncharacterized protein LOC110033148 n=1 Tax=Phalaenopsis equestris TaxID=78828 RepID=UPI0009E3D6D2|nr:uncharacterized protein LOC110033148 [Phalaenopsis equestris]
MLRLYPSFELPRTIVDATVPAISALQPTFPVILVFPLAAIAVSAIINPLPFPLVVVPVISGHVPPNSCPSPSTPHPCQICVVTTLPREPKFHLVAALESKDLLFRSHIRPLVLCSRLTATFEAPVDPLHHPEIIP